MATWRNWAGNQQAHPAAVEHPRHSFTPTALTDGIVVDLARMASILSADLSTGLVNVQAGIPLHRLNRALWDLGLSMTNLGDIEQQTIAGATSTATHGTGPRFGGLATQIRGLELVTGDGSVVSCSATERPEIFDSARVGLGALGVITAVTLQCEPRFFLGAVEEPMPLDRTMAQLDDLADGNDHFEFYWFPYTEVALTKRNNRLPEGSTPQPLRAFREVLDDEVLSNGLFGLTCRIGPRWPGTAGGERAVRAQLLRHVVRGVHLAAAGAFRGDGVRRPPGRVPGRVRGDPQGARPHRASGVVPHRSSVRRGGRHPAVDRLGSRDGVSRDPSLCR
jgi:hypothetical protein